MNGPGWYADLCTSGVVLPFFYVLVVDLATDLKVVLNSI